MKTILLAEDNANFRALLLMTLSGADYEVIAAADGQEAWETLQRRAVDFLLLDLNMPRMNGLELCQKVRQSEAFKGLPILMLTVKDLVEDQVHGYDSGADDYLSKSSDMPLLLSKIKALMARTT